MAETELPAGFGRLLTEALRPVFGGEPSIVSDSVALVERLKLVGCRAYSFGEISQAPLKCRRNLLVLPSDDISIPPYPVFRRLFKNSRVLTVSLLAFDPDVETAVYSLKLLARSDFQKAVDENRRWLKVVLRRSAPLALRGAGCDLTCRLSRHVSAMAPRTRVRLLPGEWDSIASYFEVGLVPDPEDYGPGFLVDGFLSVSGVVVAHHRPAHHILQPLHGEAWARFCRLRQEGLFPLRVEIENSHVRRFLAGGRDLTAELLRLTNPRWGLLLTELAFGTNVALSPHEVDWTKNSQLNEGVPGIHVGLGDGLTGVHIDLICPGVALT